MVILQDNEIPKYQQIYNQLKQTMIETNQFPPGHKLPSSRQLAEKLQVSRNTVCTAYDQLCAEGYLENRPRQGYYVSKFDRTVLRKRMSMEDSFQTKTIEWEGNGSWDYDFRPRRLDSKYFPFPLWTKLLRKVMEEYRNQLFQYGHPQGELSFRAQIARFLSWNRGLSCAPEQIVLCTGTQQALTIICQLLGSDCQTVAIESPGNIRAKAVFDNCNWKVCPVPVEGDGIQMEHLLSGSADAVYVTPSSQFPTGVVMSVGKRTRLLDWAEKRNAYIIEDDFNFYFKFQQKSIPALQGMSRANRVIYLGSFAQAAIPGLRISYMVLPTSLLERYQNMFQEYDSPVAMLLQKAMELFMNEGHFEHHLRKMNLVYKRKRDIMLSVLQEQLGEHMTVQNTGAGLHLFLAAPSHINLGLLVERAAHHGIKLQTTAAYEMSERTEAKETVLLSFSQIDQNDIVPAVKRLREAWMDGLTCPEE